MKTMSCILFLLASMAFVLVGCSDNSEPVVPSASANDDHATTLMKPSGVGVEIVESELITYFTFTDPDAGLILFLGVNDREAACGGAPPPEWLDVFNVKEIYLPNADPDARRMIYRMDGQDVGAMVYSLSGFVNPCANQPLATGTANVTRTDNDWFAGIQDNNNSNAYGVSANGSLVGPDGQMYRVSLVFRIHWDGEDIATAKRVLHVRLTPIGQE